jgi:PPM family protein phosphatase
MAWTWHEALHVGRVRPQNEDFIRIDPTLGFVAVADGVGGHAGGDWAAREATSILHRSLQEIEGVVRSFPRSKNIASADVERAVGSAYEQAHRAVTRASVAEAGLAGMSTTLTSAIVLGDRVLVAHVGDSRAYLVGERHVEQLTEDHVQHRSSIQPGAPHGRPLNRAIGVRAPKPDLRWVDLSSEHHGLLLCSDGLSDLLEGEEELARAWFGFGPDKCCDALVDLALSRGAPDNIAVAAVARRDAFTPDELEEASERWSRVTRLKGAPLLQDLPALRLGEWLGDVRTTEWSEGEQIPPMSEPGIRLLLRGRIELSLDGRSTVSPPGALLDEQRLVLPEGHLYDRRALDAVEILEIPTKCITDMLLSDPRAASRILWEALGDLATKVDGLRTEAEVRS